MKIVIVFTLLFGLAGYSCQSQSPTGEVDAMTFYRQIHDVKDGVILDVRTPEEFRDGFIPKAVNLDYHDKDFRAKLDKLDKNKTHFVYCQAGGRSHSAATLMRKSGFKSVVELDGGLEAWEKNKLPIEKVQDKN